MVWMGDIHKSVIQNTNTISFEHELCSVLIFHYLGIIFFHFSNMQLRKKYDIFCSIFFVLDSLVYNNIFQALVVVSFTLEGSSSLVSNYKCVYSKTLQNRRQSRTQYPPSRPIHPTRDHRQNKTRADHYRACYCSS